MPRKERRKTKRKRRTLEKKHLTGRWASSTMFVLAASGAAVGFNNLWQFPYIAGEYGGGAFVIVYFFCILLIGLPLLMAEVMLGRAGRASPVFAFYHLTEQARARHFWVFVGALGILGGFLIFSYLSVIAGWTMAYTLRSALGVFSGLTADGISSLFTALVNDPEKQLFWHTLFVVMTMVAGGRGLRLGLEPVIRHAAPVMFILLFILFLYASSTGEFEHALIYLFEPDFTRLTGIGILTAMAHAFFSLGLGVGVMLMYGAYLDEEVSIARTSLAVAGIDTAVALMGAVIVFSVLFAGKVELSSGAGLVFQALPLAFDHIPLGRIFGTLFFALLVVIAWLTAIALVEPAMVWLGERFGLSRFKAALLTGTLAWTLGLAAILSFNYWAFSFKFLGSLKKLGFFDILQILTSQALLPVGGILIALFAGWVMAAASTRERLAMRSPCAFDSWIWAVRLVTPALLLIVLLNIHKLFA